MAEAGRRRRIAAWVLGPVGLVLVVGAVVAAWADYTTGTVSSAAMEPGYRPGERLLFERIGADEVRRGDVVLIDGQDRYGGPVLERVIGEGGDRVAERRGGPVTVNGKALPERYVKDGDPSGGAPAFDVTVPEGRLFLLGDHRADARDSRWFLDEQSGTLPAAGVRARVTEDRGGPLLLGLAALLGLALAVTGLVLGIVARVARHRERRPAVPPAWGSAPPVPSRTH
ncbi:signal peptidase I [Streptomyces sp. ME19-03-3]|nr:signal peptidase I [Streptomyces sp. ME19-03-3]